MQGAEKVYVDGGVVRQNPSPIGGTWACVLVDVNGRELDRASGFVSRESLGMDVTNNFTELLAAVEGLERLPDGWSGTLHTDSNVTRCRIIGRNPGMNGIPQALRDRLAACKKRLGFIRVVLLDGHPTRDQLFRGSGKRGNPVSKWNVLCDELCTIAGRANR